MSIPPGNGPSVTGFDFDRVSADDYERFRPDYSPAAVDWLVEAAGLASGSSVLDLGAGTGKLTRLLAAAGLEVTAVEPSPAMRAKLAQAVPTAKGLDGTAESIPLLDSSANCVTVAQAFHHFHAEAALREIHRVLRSDGVLALFWNVYASESPVKIELDRIIDRHIDPESAVWAAFGAWPRAFETTDLFTSAGQRSFPHEHVLPSKHLATVMATSSDVASLPAERRDALLEEIRALARTLPSELVRPAATRVDLYTRN
jgi:SAM-dependent methyltransferase